MAFTLSITVQERPDGTYDVFVHPSEVDPDWQRKHFRQTGQLRRHDPTAVMRNQEECEMFVDILRALEPFLDDAFKRKYRVPIPRHLSLVIANDRAA